MHAEFLHACLVAEDAALGLLGAGVDGEDGQTAARALQDVDAELVDAGALAGSRHAADTDAYALAAVGKAPLNHFLRNDLVLRVGALHEGHGLPQDGGVTGEDALHIVCGGEAAAGKAVAVQIGVDDGGLRHAAIHDEALIFFAILWMVHG